MRDISTKPFVIFGLILLLVVAIFGVGRTRTVYADSEVTKSNERLIVVHDGSSEKGFITRSTTVRQALEEAAIPFDASDLVEPSLDEELVASSYDINIYRARPVTVVDGAIRKKIMSAYRTPVQIVAHAGMELRSEDKTEMSLSSGASGGAASVQLIITRATPFTLVLYGKKTAAYTQAKTVADMLQEKGITLGKDDTLSVDARAPLAAGMVVELWREGKQTATVEEDVAFGTEQIQDADRETGFREVVTPGVNGKRTVTYEIEMKNGVEVGRTEIQSVTVAEPVKQVERVGIKPKYLPYTGGGSKTEWLAAAGIPEEYWGYADYMVGRESGWNPNAINKYSGACGLAQALPCSKVPGNPLDPVDSLRWMNGYVNGRYGGWEGAYSFWQRNKWY